MKKKFYFILFILLCVKTSAQEHCFAIDSINVYSIPLSTQTRLSLTDYDIRNFNEYYRNKKLIKDSAIISEFLKIDVFDQNNKIDDCYQNGCIDVRIVLDIYYKEGFFLTVSMNKKGFYVFSNRLYKNVLFNKWISDNIVPLN